MRTSESSIILPGRAVRELMDTVGWSASELARHLVSERRRLTPRPTASTIGKWARRERLSYPVSLCIRDTAAEQRLVWRRGRWVATSAKRLTGAGVVQLLRDLDWTQTRLARELDTRQQSVARWVANPDKQLSGLATYALHRIREKHADAKTTDP